MKDFNARTEAHCGVICGSCAFHISFQQTLYILQEIQTDFIQKLSKKVGLI